MSIILVGADQGCLPLGLRPGLPLYLRKLIAWENRLWAQISLLPAPSCKGDSVPKDIPQVNQRRSPKTEDAWGYFQAPPSVLLHVIPVIWKDGKGTLTNVLLAVTFELWRWETGTEYAPGHQEGSECRPSGFLWRPVGQLFFRTGLRDATSTGEPDKVLIGPASPGIDSEIRALLPHLWSFISPCWGLWVSSSPVGALRPRNLQPSGTS